MKTTVFTLVAALSIPNFASANWSVQNSGEDVFGNVNVTATSFGDNGNLIRFECGSSSEPFFVFLVRDGSGEIPEFQAKFLHVDQNGVRTETDAILTSWNEKYVAVKVTDTQMLRRVAEHMVSASKAIPVGVIVPVVGIKISDTFSPRGSTAAGNAVLQHCLDN